jgi:hypothetical protein
MKQVKEIEEMLGSKENASLGQNEANKLKDQIPILSKKIH